MPTKIDRAEQTERAREISEQARERAREIGEQARERAKERLESNTEYQHGKTMTREERHRSAVDRMTKLNIEHAAKNGKELTETQARAFAQEIGQNHIRRNG